MKICFQLICISLLSILIAGRLNAQTTVISDSHLVNTRANVYNWTINGISFKPKAEKTIIYPNYPGIDTIIFTDNYGTDTIFTRIPLNHEYIFTIGCCDAGFDIFEKSKYDILINEFRKDSLGLKFDSLYISSKEYGQVKFSIKNKNKKDTLIAIYSDLSGPVEGQMLINNSTTEWIYPSKGFFANSIDLVVIAKMKPETKYKTIENSNSIILMGIGLEEVIIMHRIQIRVFNNERVEIEYDCRTKKVEIRFVE